LRAGRQAGFAIRNPKMAAAMRRARRIGLVRHSAELARLALVIRRLAPRRVLEIGTLHGGSLYLWSRVSDPDALIISVDLPPWELDDSFEPAKVEQLKRLGRARQRVECIRADSHAPATLAAVREFLAGEPLDFLSIDGDDSSQGLWQDYADYGALVRPGGLIALHGTQAGGQGIELVWQGAGAARAPAGSPAPGRTLC
jgi:predicted O-methyltransferase YrrM